MDSAQKDVIRKAIVRFHDRLVVSEEFLNILCSGNHLTAADADDIKSKSTRRDRNRELLSTIRRKSRDAFDGLHEALVATRQYDLARILKPDIPLERRLSPTEHHTDGADSDFSEDDTYLDETNTSVDDIDLAVKPTTEKIKKRFNTPQVYPMSTANDGTRGRGLIINNEWFEHPSSRDQTPLRRRLGSHKDTENIRRVLEKLNFEVEVRCDISKQEFIPIIAQETKHPRHKDYGMFVLVIMSHGTPNDVYGSDCRPVKLHDVYDQLGPPKFKAMAGKPKWIIVQACNGDGSDYDYNASNDDSFAEERPSPAAPHHVPPAPPELEPSTIELPHPQTPKGWTARQDYNIMMASFTGFVAVRHPRQGSWFIRALVEALYKHAGHAHLGEIFEQVQRKVSRKSLKAQAAGHPVSTQDPVEIKQLNGKCIYLFPGYNG